MRYRKFTACRAPIIVRSASCEVAAYDSAEAQDGRKLGRLYDETEMERIMRAAARHELINRIAGLVAVFSRRSEAR